jgi:hypothetical protein
MFVLNGGSCAAKGWEGVTIASTSWAVNQPINFMNSRDDPLPVWVSGRRFSAPPSSHIGPGRRARTDRGVPKHVGSEDYPLRFPVRPEEE